MADALERQSQRLRETPGAGLVTLQQVIGHALRGLRADAGEAAECGDELIEGGGCFHSFDRLQ
jgi:hypothetical protein